jgi:hypothetical protein
MESVNVILIIIIAIILVYILYRIISKQQKNLSPPTPPYDDETTVSKESELTAIENISNGSGISSLNIIQGMPLYLRDYCIKSSSNSAYSGGYMNLNAIKYVLSRGCRFLDFEVYYKDGFPVIAHSTTNYDPSYSSFTSKGLPVSLGGVFSTILLYGFNDNSPNPSDPLFVHLRIKSNVNDVYQAIATSASSILKNRLFMGNVGPETPISTLREQIVLIVDRNTSPNYANYPTCLPGQANCYNLKNVINMESGANDVRVYRENDLLNQSINPPDPSVYMMRIVLPQVGIFGTRNCDSMYLVKNYGAQMIAEAFYINDARLAVYEDMFRTYKTAFVPMQFAIEYAIKGT